MEYSRIEKETILAYYDWLVYFHNQSDFDEKREQSLNQQLVHLKQAQEEHFSFLARLYLVRLKSFYYEMTHQYSELNQLWEQFEDFLANNRRFKMNIIEFELSLKKLAACLNGKEFEKRAYYAEVAKNRFQPGQLNWFIFQEYWFLLLVHLKRYQAADQILNEVFESRYYSNLPTSFQEKWLLMNGYLAFAKESNWDFAFNESAHAGQSEFRSLSTNSQKEVRTNPASMLWY